MNKLIFAALLAGAFVTAGFAQQGKKPTAPGAQNSAATAVRSTAAYAELLLRRTELESTLEDLLVAYKDEFPKVKETRFELELIEKDLARLSAFGAGDAPKMTLALGKLLVRRAELQTDLWSARSQYSEEHPNVERARRRVASFDKAIGEILP